MSPHLDKQEPKKQVLQSKTLRNYFFHSLEMTERRKEGKRKERRERNKRRGAGGINKIPKEIERKRQTKERGRN